MTRLSPEREAEIRRVFLVEHFTHYDLTRDLLAEIDALREERDGEQFRLRKALCRVLNMPKESSDHVFDRDLQEWWEANKTEEDVVWLERQRRLRER